jgi:hypothetical protein
MKQGILANWQTIDRLMREFIRERRCDLHQQLLLSEFLIWARHKENINGKEESVTNHAGD